MVEFPLLSGKQTSTGSIDQIIEERKYAWHVRYATCCWIRNFGHLLRLQSCYEIYV